jgi:hypothetical protein
MATNLNVSVTGHGLVERSKQQQRDARTGRLTREAITRDAETNREEILRDTASQPALSRALAPSRPIDTETAPYLRSNRPAGTRIPLQADYYVITYGFERPGRDLDTRTRLFDPATREASNVIGWCKDDKILYNGITIIEWGGDNTGFGVESVLVSVKDYAEQVAALGIRAAPLRISLSAFWFSSFAPEVTITVTGYKGGSMVYIPSRFTWENPTATRVWADFSQYISRDVRTRVPECVDGDLIAYLTIDYRKGRIVYSQNL